MFGDASTVITSLTGLVSAVGVIVLGFLQYRMHRTVQDVKSTGDLTATAVTMQNGHTLGETVEGVADAVSATPAQIFPTEPETRSA